MSHLELRSPRPYDLVGGEAVGAERVPIAFISYGSGGGVRASVKDSAGAELAAQNMFPAGSGEFGGPFALTLDLPSVPTTKYGTVELGWTGFPPEVVVPLVFGSFIMPGYFTYVQHTVLPGDTLWDIADAQYKVASEWPFIYEANSHQIADPDLIYAGQVLNIPHSTTTIFHR